ncbi:unnamed protein product, partial [Didymodactylos carnosus]
MSIRVPGNVQELVWLQELPLGLVHGQTFEHFIYINHTLQLAVHYSSSVTQHHIVPNQLQIQNIESNACDDQQPFLDNTNNNQLVAAHQQSDEIKTTKPNQWFDMTLLKDYAFILFLISNLLTNFGFNVPYSFTEDLAKQHGIREESKHITMAIGIGSIAGRVVIGFLGDIKK